MKKFFFVMAFTIALLSTAVAQESKAAPPADAHARQSSPQKKSAESDAQTPGQQLAHASNTAAEGGEAEGDETAQFKHSPVVRWLSSKLGISVQSEYWVLYSIDFLIIALAIGWVWKANIPAAFRARTASIRKTMDEAQTASADANRRLGEIEGRLSRLDQEIAQMRASAEAEAVAEEARIRAAAEEDSRKIVEASQAEIESASRTAQRDLKAYAAQLAVELAEKKIQVDPATDRQLVQRFSRELGAGDGKESR